MAIACQGGINGDKIYAETYVQSKVIGKIDFLRSVHACYDLKYCTYQPCEAAEHPVLISMDNNDDDSMTIGLSLLIDGDIVGPDPGHEREDRKALPDEARKPVPNKAS